MGVYGGIGLRFSGSELSVGSAHDDIMNLWQLGPDGAAGQTVTVEAGAESVYGPMTDLDIAMTKDSALWSAINVFDALPSMTGWSDLRQAALPILFC